MDSPISYLVCAMFFLLLPLPSMFQSNGIIHLASSFTATSDKDSTWTTSSSGDFSLGFRRTAPRSLLLAIWFERVPGRTIVWSANRDIPVQPPSSRIVFTSNGDLILYAHDGKQVWSAQHNSDSPVAFVMLLDTGNLVLSASQNASENYVWESFKNPTDTILPSQIFTSNLSSPSTPTDYSNGRFQLRLRTDGDLLLFAVNRATRLLYGSYWKRRHVSGLVFHESGILFLNQTNGNSERLFSPQTSLDLNGDFYIRATLDFDGVFRQYVYPKNRQGEQVCLVQSWYAVDSIPNDICEAFFDGSFGSGVCGFNSYCKTQPSYVDDGRRPTCECPPHYSFLDPEDEFKGCKPDFSPHACDSSDDARKRFVMEEINSVDWPTSDFELDEPVDEDRCKDDCLIDCLCAVSIFSNGNCWKKKLPLSRGRPESTRKAFFKVPRGNLSSEALGDECSAKKDRTSVIIIGSLILGCSVFLNLLLAAAILLALLYSRHRRRLLQKIHHPADSSLLAEASLRSFSFKELEEVTDGFKEEIGHGSFGSVYKGVIGSDSRNFVAVKRLDKMVVQEGEREFIAEVRTIGQTHHKNLVRLLGYCDEEPDHRILVYEFMGNGSLATFLFGSQRLDWNQRIRIVLGIARGLMYLHEGCSTQIIHCDIKPQNILLDDRFTAKISDFGLAKLSKKTDQYSRSGIRGTKGYVAPEWFMNVTVTAKVDVYSFGVMLLEIVCCRKSVEVELGEEKAVLVNWAYRCYREGRVDKMVDNEEEAANDMKQVGRLVGVAIWCVQEDPSRRPSMKKVIQMIEGIVDIRPPDPPFHYLYFTKH